MARNVLVTLHPIKRKEIDVDSDGFSSLHRSVCVLNKLCNFQIQMLYKCRVRAAGVLGIKHGV